MRFALSLLFSSLILMQGCPESDDDDSAADDDTATPDDDTADDDACDPLVAGDVLSWDGVAALAAGDVAEIEAADGAITVHLAESGSYLAIVISRGNETDTAWDLAVGGGGRRATPPAVTDAEAPFQPPGAQNPVALRDPIGDPTVPEAGEIRSFDIPGNLFVQHVDAEAIIVTDELVVYEDIDTENPLAALDPIFVNDVMLQFEDIALPRERFFFHDESDVNADGHVSVLFSYAVNQTGAMAFVTSCDLQPSEVCGYGNEQELIYAGIPDPDEPQSSVNGVTELIAHEFNHNIYFASRFLDNDATDVRENVYLTEGTSALAQDLCGYNNGNLYVWAAALEDPWNTSLPDVFVYESGAHYYSERDGQLRGLAYLVFRYLYDRYGAEDALEDGSFGDTCGVGFLNDWFTSPTPGLDGVEEITGLDPTTFALDFWTAIGTHQRVDEGMAADPAFHFQPPSTDLLTEYQRGVDFYMTIHGWKEVSGVGTYELLEPATVDLRSGGAAYFLGEGVPAGHEIALQTDAAADAVLRVVRID